MGSPWSPITDKGDEALRENGKTIVREQCDCRVGKQIVCHTSGEWLKQANRGRGRGEISA